MTTPWTFIFVFVLGALIGAAELISRHSDYRLRAISTGPSVGYLCFNGILSIFALLIIQLTHPDWLGYKLVGDRYEPDQPLWTILTAGFGAAAFFRSSIFKIKTGDGDVSVGPSLIIDVFLNAIDESVDRVIGEQRLIEVATLMANVDFEKAYQNLPTLCFAALRRLPAESQSQAASQLKELHDRHDMNAEVKANSLGLTILNLTGLPILRQAVKQLGGAIK
jgi:hypothetical protein